MPKFNIVYAVLSEDIVVLKKPPDMSMQSFLRFIMGSLEKASQDYDLQEILKGFRGLQSEIDFSRMGL